MTSPSPLFKLNGGAAGVKLSVSAAGLITATLDDTSGVTYVEWAIIGTDETTAPGNYTLSVTSGSVPGSQTTTFNAGAAGTAGILRARINHGVNPLTGNAASEGENDVTIATAKWYVPAAISGLEVFVDGEVNESDAVHGQTGELNQTIRLAGGGGPSAFTYIELGTGTKAGLGLIRMSRNFVAMACRTAAAVNHPILAEDNTDGFQWGDSTLTARWVTDVKTGGTWGLRVNGVTMVQMASTGISLGTGAKYGVAGVDHTSSATASSLMFRDVGGRAQVADPSANADIDTKGARNTAIVAASPRPLSASISVDTSNSNDSGAWTDLLSVSYTATKPSLTISATACAESDLGSRTIEFRLLYDGSAIAGGGATMFPFDAAAPVCMAITVLKTGVVGGAHTIKLQWRPVLSGGSTASILVVSATNGGEHATLLVSESEAYS